MWSFIKKEKKIKLKTEFLSIYEVMHGKKSNEKNMNFSGIFYWHSKHNTKNSVLQNKSTSHQMEHKQKSAKYTIW